MPDRHPPPYARRNDWWTRSTVYQIYPRSFADSNGDGIGDLRGILGRLDYLQALGVDVVWLSPVYRSPDDDNGYDISDYYDVDPRYGTLADLDELLSAVHERGIKLIMDLVVNHTSDEHEWFVESRSSKDNPKRDWYWWRPPRPDSKGGDPGAEPNNWGSFFSGPTWEFDETTGEYYLHLFSRKQADLNWENADVRTAIYEMMRWWLDRGIDGFRMDVINMISKHPELPDGITIPGWPFGLGFPYFICGPRNHEYVAEMHREVFADYDRPLLSVGEMPMVRVEDARLFTDPDRHELDMVFQFDHVMVDHGTSKFDRKPVELTTLKGIFDRWQEGLADVGWNSLYWNNHDQPRAVSRFGDDGEHRVRSAKLLATALHMQRGTPFVYQGEELGMTNMPFASIDEVRDIESMRHCEQAFADGADEADVLMQLRVASRDNARTPMQWDDSPNAGFTTGKPWIDVNPNHVDVNAAAALSDEESVFHHYRRLIELRRNDPVVAHGDFADVLPDDEHIYAFTRGLDGEVVLTLCNFCGDDRCAAVPDADDWARADVILSNYPDTPVASGGGLELRPWEAVVLRRRP